MGALELTNALIESKEKMRESLKHAAIGLAKLDYEDFLKGDYFKEGKIYIDEPKATYEALNFTRKGATSFYGLLNPKTYLKAFEASSKGISGNLKGDGIQLGGTLILDKKGNIIYKHVQSSYSDQPLIDDIVKAVENYLEENKLI
jgi:prostamide/prostaglandin F2alpha synthase